MSEKPWKLYIIENGPFSYCGVSPDPVRRLRQHNGEIRGGAKYTTSKSPNWKHVCIIEGFPTKIESMQLEWAIKNCPPKRKGGIDNRIRKMFKTLNKKRWTSYAPLAETVPLKINWCTSNSFSHIPRKLPVYIEEVHYHPS